MPLHECQKLLRHSHLYRTIYHEVQSVAGQCREIRHRPVYEYVLTYQHSSLMLGEELWFYRPVEKSPPFDFYLTVSLKICSTAEPKPSTSLPPAVAK